MLLIVWSYQTFVWNVVSICLWQIELWTKPVSSGHNELWPPNSNQFIFDSIQTFVPDIERTISLGIHDFRHNRCTTRKNNASSHNWHQHRVFNPMLLVWLVIGKTKLQSHIFSDLLCWVTGAIIAPTNGLYGFRWPSSYDNCTLPGMCIQSKSKCHSWTASGW